MKVMEGAKMKNEVEKQKMPRLFQLWAEIMGEENNKKERSKK